MLRVAARRSPALSRLVRSPVRHSGTVGVIASFEVRPVVDNEWEVVAWLWQGFKNDGLTGDRRSMAALWVAPAVRRDGVGRQLALDVMGRRRGQWSVAVQHENLEAGEFWRRVADQAVGCGAWREDQRPVPDFPAAHRTTGKRPYELVGYTTCREGWP